LFGKALLLQTVKQPKQTNRKYDPGKYDRNHAKGITAYTDYHSLTSNLRKKELK